MTLTRDLWLLSVGVAICTAGCRNSSESKGANSAAVSRTKPAVTGLTSATGWDSAAGSMLILPSSTDSTTAAIVLPGMLDSTLALTSRFELGQLDSTPVDLFNQRGAAGSSVLHVVSQSVDPSSCVNWPMGSLLGVPPVGWKVGLERGKAAGIPLNSLMVMVGQDSARFVSDVVGAVASLGDMGDAAFRGLPFSVRRGYRVAISPSAVILAEVVRKINEEANPREEHVLLLAERQTETGAYRVVFTARSAGAEESLETSDALAAFQLVSTRQPAIVISFEYEDGGRVGLLQRFSDGNWKIRWKSAYTGC